MTQLQNLIINKLIAAPDVQVLYITFLIFFFKRTLCEFSTIKKIKRPLNIVHFPLHIANRGRNGKLNAFFHKIEKNWNGLLKNYFINSFLKLL